MQWPRCKATVGQSTRVCRMEYGHGWSWWPDLIRSCEEQCRSSIPVISHTFSVVPSTYTWSLVIIYTYARYPPPHTSSDLFLTVWAVLVPSHILTYLTVSLQPCRLLTLADLVQIVRDVHFDRFSKSFSLLELWAQRFMCMCARWPMRILYF